MNKMGDKVECNGCGWTGAEDDLIPFDDEDGGGYGCPNCKTDVFLKDVQPETTS